MRSSETGTRTKQRNPQLSKKEIPPDKNVVVYKNEVGNGFDKPPHVKNPNFCIYFAGRKCRANGYKMYP